MDATDLIDPLDRLAHRLLGGPVTALVRLTGGASQELWSFDAGGAGHVLRRAPGGALFAKLETVGLATEAAVIAAAGEHGVPVPAIAHVLVPEDDLGEGFVAARMPGEALGRRIVADPAFASARATLLAQLAGALVRIHATPQGRLPPLVTRSPTDSLDQLERELRSFAVARPVFEAGLRWLRDHCPDVMPPRLVHGDFRIGNVLVDAQGLTAVLDWEACHLGDWHADLGWLCNPAWRYGRLDLAAGGIGTREALFAAYEAAGGGPVDPARARWWEVRGILRWGLTCLAMAEAFLAGDPAIERAAVGRRASEAELDLLHALTGRD